MEERALDRWMALEIGSLGKAIVTAPRRLADVASGDAPSAKTRGGEAHAFDPSAASRLRARLSPLLALRARVPMTFYADKATEGGAYVEDETTIAVLKAIGRIPADGEPRDGKLWIGLPLAHDVAREYPTLFQFVVI